MTISDNFYIHKIYRKDKVNSTPTDTVWEFLRESKMDTNETFVGEPLGVQTYKVVQVKDDGSERDVGEVSLIILAKPDSITITRKAGSLELSVPAMPPLEAPYASTVVKYFFQYSEDGITWKDIALSDDNIVEFTEEYKEELNQKIIFRARYETLTSSSDYFMAEPFELNEDVTIDVDLVRNPDGSYKVSWDDVGAVWYKLYVDSIEIDTYTPLDTLEELFRALSVTSKVYVSARVGVVVYTTEAVNSDYSDVFTFGGKFGTKFNAPVAIPFTLAESSRNYEKFKKLLVERNYE